MIQGGQVVKYTALLACGNYHGVVGFAKAKGPAIPIALQKVHESVYCLTMAFKTCASFLSIPWLNDSV